MSRASSLAQANRRLVAKLFLLTAAMFGFGYALVPLYSVFCQLTGLNGTTGRADAQAVQASQIDSADMFAKEALAGAILGQVLLNFLA